MRARYLFDSNLDTDQAFKYAPFGEIDISVLPTLPDDWLDELCKLSCLSQPIEEKTSNPFKKHVEDSCLGERIKAALQLVYHCLKGHLDKQIFRALSDSDKKAFKAAIITKLQEEIDR